MHALHRHDTIYARATAPGRSGVAVIRISGPQACHALEHFGFKKSLKPRYAHLHRFTCNGEMIDEGLILYFPAPHSFTGEDVLEFQHHGGSAIIKRMLEELSSLPDFRHAEAGEFAQRAFLNGKMDLTAAEGLADLIDAETELQRRQAAILMQGHAADFYHDLRDRMLEPLALLEAYIDFPEEDIPESVQKEVNDKIIALQKDIETQLNRAFVGEKIREGFTVVLLGAPNAGKSSLMNALAKRDIAIVSHQPGTTRDALEVSLDLNGLPVTLVDTAGLREQAGDIEQEGIKRARKHAEAADLKLVLFDQTQPADEDSAALLDDTAQIIFTKIDLEEQHPSLSALANSSAALSLSTSNGDGVEQLIQHLHETLSQKIPHNHHAFVVRERHRVNLHTAFEELSFYLDETELEIQCERLRRAAVAIGTITGHIDVEDLLDAIFSRFCIGK